MNDISDRVNIVKLQQLIKSIRNGLLIPMGLYGGKTPPKTIPSPGPDVEDSIENPKSINTESIS
jgi:hypothetical protein